MLNAKLRVGIIGCGHIFVPYVKGCRAFPILELVGCADLDAARAETRAAEFGLAAYTVEGLLADPRIDLVINLTVPAAHAAVSLAVIAAGKHLYSEKPLGITRTEGQAILAAAEARGVMAGAAPDTFLGGGLQTARHVLDAGAIGEPVAAVAFFLGHGPERWHPDPGFFYRRGGGPLLDMGPYYLTALVNLLGPVARVTASARASFAERVSPGPERPGERFPVEVPTHSAGVLDFTAGPIASIITSFDVYGHNLPRIEVYGSRGSLSVPDPNKFGGSVQVRGAGDEAWRAVPLTSGSEAGRGIGVADMACALRDGRPPRAAGELAYHALDVMEALLEASACGQHVRIASTATRPAALPREGLAGLQGTACP